MEKIDLSPVFRGLQDRIFVTLKGDGLSAIDFGVICGSAAGKKIRGVNKKHLEAYGGKGKSSPLKFSKTKMKELVDYDCGDQCVQIDLNAFLSVVRNEKSIPFLVTSFFFALATDKDSFSAHQSLSLHFFVQTDNKNSLEEVKSYDLTKNDTNCIVICAVTRTPDSARWALIDLHHDSSNPRKSFIWITTQKDTKNCRVTDILKWEKFRSFFCPKIWKSSEFSKPLEKLRSDIMEFREDLTISGLLKKYENAMISMSIRASDLRKADLTSQSDPYFVLSYKEQKFGISEDYVLYTSEVIVDNDVSPAWSPFSIDISKLPKFFKFDTPLVCRLFDKDKMLKDDDLGFCEFSLEDVFKKMVMEYDICDLKEKKKKPKLVVEECYCSVKDDMVLSTTLRSLKICTK